MPHASGHGRSGRSRFRLNSDGRRHPLENALSVCTILCGLIAFVAGFIPAAHSVASFLGVLGFFGGLYSQYISATTQERALNIVGIVASFVGVAFGIRNGGFLP
ncbi:hypothetical protein AB0G15_12350 [Streptosporangium sp. NPDC023825]|uniref:hypothetical protein n=1 Tax=Streptosporangium sp. NPDC023825 TaxID=3154909 RepID=UPI003414A81B